MKARFDAILSHMESNLWNLHIPVPDKVYQDFNKAAVTRVIVRYGDQVERPAAFMGKGDGSFYFIINTSEAKKLNLQIGDVVQVEIEKDDSTYGMPMPDEMQERMNQDPEAEAYFEALVPGTKRSILYVIGKPKTPQNRLEKAISLCNYLKAAQGQFVFKEFHQALKQSRFKIGK